MRLPLKDRGGKSSITIRMTPLIDVIFLLMIFFIMTINFQKPESVLENLLPHMGEQGQAEEQKDWEVVRLRVKLLEEDSRLKIYLQQRVVDSYAELLEYLNQLPQDIMIVIEPAPRVPYKYVIGVYNSCMQSKKNNIVFSISS